ncbi:glycosyltransferase family 8 protein [Cohnella suwonensis]|uniref:Glycosyltransferase family 8 protein n=1 Tax=Cohnella suwonensis TaxID=696072 RepID=A0ABW0M206_9BACL
MDHPLDRKEIHIVGAIDNIYSQHLGVAFASMLINMSPGTMAYLYVLSAGLTEENKAKLKKTVSRFAGACIQFIHVDGSIYEQFIVSGQITRATYLRLAIPDALPTTIQKVIYMDSDVVVTGNIVELWDTDLRGHAIAAVIDPHCAYLRCKALQIPEKVYFNNGIMVMNLTKWREESISRKITDYTIRNTKSMVFPSQDPMNAVLYNDWLELPPTWNGHTSIMKEWKDSNPPAVIHYTDVSKPWHLDNFHPYKNEYYKYKRLTEWRSSKPEINLNRMMTRLMKKVLPRPVKKAVKKVMSLR